MRGQTNIILALVFAVFVAIFAVINVDPVQVNYLFGNGEAPLVLVILISVLMGGVITAAVGAVKLIRLQRKIKTLTQENKRLKETLEGNPTETDAEDKQKPMENDQAQGDQE
ncbi:LapA family protein [Terrihalobacillus insolitus]|uniref:LapA family protein n=1 Tax=Terrihalobacillus insolitus TaxID=2950438 RepID=UPI002340E387|nr:lipopolysaccharide assembly protein LapA domain-containing protein [Terrihalobacillus insolitus]MDC3412432.1 lipopolysaccharide assembly protein LapA domain-containing protein [Terrihalobacillus insolitus]